MRSAAVTLWFVLASLGCLPSATVTVPTQPAPELPPPAPSGPRYARISGTIMLHADPDATAQHIELAPGPGTANERIVELLETNGDWWLVRTLLPDEVRQLGFDASMGVALLSLEGWVEARPGIEVERGSPSTAPLPADPKPGPLPPPEMDLYAVRAGTQLRWLDGRVAGEALVDHYFHVEGTAQVGRTAEESIDMWCHERRTAPGLGVVQGSLCISDQDALDSRFIDDRTALAFDEPPPPPPDMPTVEGALDKDPVRRIVRAHINEVRNCYNQGLMKDPQLAGRVTIKFVIEADGGVGSAVVEANELSEPQVGQCISGAVLKWNFPKPRGGGNVIVIYPFVLTPG
jgi:hypothetical protein